ncbi:MAG: Gfo/Idh/MocA family oxidoreductase [Myxococcales bacterium]|nr:Gfo/Idh/MocA family oxidoreductase [Myxococcales bacterium]
MQVAVVGAGRWGALHAAKLAALPGVTLAAVVDADARRAAALAARHPGARPWSAWRSCRRR